MSGSIKQTKSGRDLLKKLEAEDNYVFHGSDNADLDFLEPRQAYDYKNGVNEPDGEPAVFASSRADYAIMMALINQKNCPKGYHASATVDQTENKQTELNLRATKNSLGQLDENSFGYVYVFAKNLFSEKDSAGIEYLSKIPVKMVNKIKVTKSDLPPDIKILED